MSAFDASRWADAFIKLTGDQAEEGLAVLEQVALGVRAASVTASVSSHFAGRSCAARIESALKSFEKGSDAAVKAQRLVVLLARSGHLFKIDELVDSVKAAIKKRDGIVAVIVETVFPLDEKNRKSLKEILKIKYSAKKIELVEKINPSLLGGIRIQVGAERIDHSLRGSLGSLSSTLGVAKQESYKW